MSKLLRPVCVVLTEDNAIKCFDKHDPYTSRADGKPLTLNLNYNDVGQALHLRLCQRCGVAYVESSTVTFDQPSPGAVKSPQEGNA